MTEPRVELEVATLAPAQAYRWLTASVVPRPIAWVSTLSAEGVANLAPHSFFTVASAAPPVIAFTSVGTKDSLRNIRATGEFVVCVATAALHRQVNETGARFPPEVDELAHVGLAAEPSVAVRPARVANSPVALECVLEGERSFGSDPGASVMVFGRVVHVSARPEVLAEDGLPDAALMAPVARLGRDEWSHLGEVFTLPRPEVKA